jgi:retron-type reverse transcriptase
LGPPSWTDKLVGEVVRLLLEAYYEPRFEGDIADCFGGFDHDVMLAILAKHFRDNRFLRLVRNVLQAGYLEA